MFLKGGSNTNGNTLNWGMEVGAGGGRVTS